MKIIIEKELGSVWGTDEELAKMSDEEIFDLCLEDMTEFIDNATWMLKR